MKRLLPRVLIGLGLVSLACCSSSAKSSQGTTTTVPSVTLPVTSTAPPAGTAKVVFAGHTNAVSVTTCVETGKDALNLTGVGAGGVLSTLTVNLGNPVSASTMVFTLRQPDNSFANISMASATKPGLTSGSRAGNRVTLTGHAVEQAYTAKGTPAYAPLKGEVSLDASCRTVKPEQPAVSTGSGKPSSPKRSTPTTKP